MPRRWLSTRGRKEEQKKSDLVRIPPNEFDFAFTEPQALVECPPETWDVEKSRPTTAGGHFNRPKQKPDLTLLIERPRSADSSYLKTPLSARFDTSRIGLALGSPRHPPQEFTPMASTVSPQLRQLACCDGDDGLQPTMKARKWKLSPFFKQKVDMDKDIPCQLRTHHPDMNKLGLPIQRTPWRNPKSPPVTQTQFTDDNPPPPPEKDKPCATTTGRNQKLRCTAILPKDAVPVVEVVIPVTPLDRYSVMFKDIEGLKRSELLVRRSRELENLTVRDNKENQQNDLCIPQLRRRVTSPTARVQQEPQRGVSNPSSSQKYSLFPTTPTTSRSQSSGISPRSCRMRSATTPVSSSTIISEKNVREQNPNYCLKGSSSGPKDISVDSAPPVILSTGADSRASSSSDIFFDVKSLRDSSGQIGQQFVMTRPPSVAIQLVRSQSDARKRQKLDINGGSDARSPQMPDTSDRSTTAQIDETIEIVESLTSVSTVISKQENPPSSHGSRTSPQRLDTSGSKMKKSSRKGSVDFRLQRLYIGGVPSPVPEDVEEAIEETTISRHQDPVLRRDEHTSIAAPPQASSPQPCTASPLPMKDVHNIPLSKYAPSHTTTDLIRQTGLRPVRSARANTETAVSSDPLHKASRPMGPPRSATLPLPSDTPRSKYVENTPAIIKPSSSDTNGQESLAVAVYVKPAAEVSVARTVSLSRRHSAKVKVKRPQNRQEREQVIEKQVSLGVPIVQNVHKKHQHGQSLNIVLETATIAPSSPPPPMPSPTSYALDTPLREHFALYGAPRISV